MESILDIFMSKIRHRERTTFILCDNLVEVACKTKARQYDPNYNPRSSNFHQALNADGVRIAAPLRRRVQDRHTNIRNLMQHQNVAITVDTETCADAIIDVVGVVDSLWRNTSRGSFREWHKVAIRIVRLYSTTGDAQKQQEFEKRMLNEPWRIHNRPARIREMLVEPGLRQHWSWVVKNMTIQVEQILDELDIS